MDYIQVLFEKSGEAYQEVSFGCVQRYLDRTGVELFVQPPESEWCRVTDGNPPLLDWMKKAQDLASAAPYDVAALGERRGAKRRSTDA